MQDVIVEQAIERKAVGCLMAFYKAAKMPVQFIAVSESGYLKKVRADKRGARVGRPPDRAQIANDARVVQLEKAQNV